MEKKSKSSIWTIILRVICIVVFAIASSLVLTQTPDLMYAIMNLVMMFIAFALLLVFLEMVDNVRQLTFSVKEMRDYLYDEDPEDYEHIIDENEDEKGE